MKRIVIELCAFFLLMFLATAVVYLFGQLKEFKKQQDTLILERNEIKEIKENQRILSYRFDELKEAQGHLTDVFEMDRKVAFNKTYSTIKEREASTRFSTVFFSWTLPDVGAIKTPVRNAIIKRLLEESKISVDGDFSDKNLRAILHKSVSAQSKEYIQNCKEELKNHPKDWYYDDAQKEIAATLHYERLDSIAPVIENEKWVTFYYSRGGYSAGAAGDFLYESYYTFLLDNGSLVNSSIFFPGSEPELVKLLRAHAGTEAKPEEINESNIPQPFLLRDGMGFVFSSFEVGYHAHGSVMLKVPYDEIGSLIGSWTKKRFGI